jgi:hypothetical protein
LISRNWSDLMTWLEPWRMQTREDLVNAVNRWRKVFLDMCRQPKDHAKFFLPNARRRTFNQARYLRQYFRRGPAVRYGSPEQYMHRKAPQFMSGEIP